MELLVVFFLRLFMLITASDLGKPFNQCILCDRFEQIILHSDVDRLFRIIEIIIAAQDHNLESRDFFLCHFCQCQPVHERHLDVRDQKIRLLSEQKRQCHLSIRSLANKFKPQILPWDHPLDRFPNDHLIFCQKNL